MSDPDYDRCDHGQRIGLDDCDKCSVIGLRSQLRRVLDERNAARTALSASEARAVAAEKRIYELEKSLLVPGVMECAKCHFYLVRTNLYVNDGTYGPGDNKTEPCPNGCGPLWPVTWKQQADEMMARCEMASARIAELEAALAAMRDERNAAGRSAHDSADRSAVPLAFRDARRTGQASPHLPLHPLHEPLELGAVLVDVRRPDEIVVLLF